MKFLGVLLVLVSAASAIGLFPAPTPAEAQSVYCQGWADGYKAGYCYGKFACLPPLVPLCPLPRLGESTYMDGYNRGFLAGLNARR